MNHFCILICTFNRDIELNRCVNSIKNNFKRTKITIVIFNFNNVEYEFRNNSNINFIVYNLDHNNGKTYNVLNFVKNNYKKYDYFMILDDKDYFIHKGDKYFIDINGRYNLYSLSMTYINHPLNKKCSAPCKKKNNTMYQYYLKKPSLNKGDRIWIFKGSLLKDAKIHDFYMQEISIQGMLTNYYLYNQLFEDLTPSPIVCREYSKSGYTNNRRKWIYDSPNSELYEIFLFIKISKNILLKIYLLILFNKKFKLVDKNKISKEILLIRKKTLIIYYIFFILWPFVKI